MWILTIILTIGAIIYFVFTAANVICSKEISKYHKIVIGLTALPTILLFMVFPTLIIEMDKLREKKPVEQYEPITYTVYKKK